MNMLRSTDMNTYQMELFDGPAVSRRPGNEPALVKTFTIEAQNLEHAISKATDPEGPICAGGLYRHCIPDIVRQEEPGRWLYSVRARVGETRGKRYPLHLVVSLLDSEAEDQPPARFVLTLEEDGQVLLEGARYPAAMLEDPRTIGIYDTKAEAREAYERIKASPHQAQAPALEHLRWRLRREEISTGELLELQSMVEFIDHGDTELLEAAGAPEFPQEVTPGHWRILPAEQGAEYEDSTGRVHVSENEAGFPLYEVRASYRDGGEEQDDLVGLVVMGADARAVASIPRLLGLIEQIKTDMDDDTLDGLAGTARAIFNDIRREL